MSQYQHYVAPDGRQVVVCPPSERRKGVVKYRFLRSTDTGVCELVEFLRTFRLLNPVDVQDERRP